MNSHHAMSKSGDHRSNGEPRRVDSFQPEWNAIKDMQSGTVSRQTLDTTLPTGPVERTMTYETPFTLQNRETDYAAVWAKLDEVRSLRELVTELRALDSVSRCQAANDRLKTEASRIAKVIRSKDSPGDTFSRRAIHLGELPKIGWLLKLTGMGTIRVPDIDFSEPSCVALFHRWARPTQ